jgi:FAD/FMN-containing dehydrogenase
MTSNELQESVRGQVIGPGDDGYDAARHMWNARFDRRPDLVAQCLDADDVAAAVRWARRNDVPISVKGGGHSYAGNTVANGGLLIDLGRMTGIRVRPDDRIAVVEAGATWAELDSATQHHGLATTGVTVSSVGVAGSTLGGGSGWLSRRFGNAIDNLLAVEIVTADGEQVRASDDENPDLFWAMRGAGANFGVATSFEFDLHEVGPEVLAGQIIYPFDDAEELLRSFRSFMADAPDDFQCFPFTFRVPPIDVFPAEYHGQPVLDFVVLHLDPSAVDVLRPLQELGEPILDAVAPTPYTVAQQAFDPNLPAGQRYYSKGHDLQGLSDAAIDTFCSHVRTMQGPLTAAYLEPRGGAVARVDEASTAAGGRTAPCAFHIIAGWMDASEDDTVMNWAQAFADDMADHATGGVYVNLIAEDEADRVPTAFSDHDRLRAMKQQWDPDNTFKNNHNIPPP